MSFYTYVYRDPSRDMQPFYVGKGKENRAHRHLFRKDMHPLVQRLQLMKKNGIEPDIEIIRAIGEDHAFFLESCLIEMFGRRDLEKGTLLNLTDGGEGPSGAVCSDKTRTKLSAAAKGRTHSPETRTKISIASKNISSETRAKISAALKGRKRAAPTLETRIKIAETKKGKPLSSETRAKMSAAHKGKTMSPETRAKISAARKSKPS